MLTQSLTALIFLTGYRVQCWDTKTTFRKIPSTMNIAGLKCARDSYTSSRGVRFNLATGECDALGDAWFSDKTILPNYNYFLLYMVEHKFEPIMSVSHLTPNSHREGMSVIMSVEVLDIVNKHELQISFDQAGSSDRPFFMDQRHEVQTTVFNSYEKNEWRSEIRTPYIFQSSVPRVYKLEFKLTPTGVQTIVDGQLVNMRTFLPFKSAWNDQVVNEFRHRMPLSAYDVVGFHSTKAICRQIQFVYQQET